MLAVLMSISVIFDVSEKIEDFINTNAPIDEIIFDYYFNFIIHYANLFSAFFVFLSVIYFTAKLAQTSEIIAIISSGVSFNRLLRPYFIAATILASVSLYLNHYTLPNANKQRLAFEETYTRHAYVVENIHRQTDPNTVIFFKTYVSTENYLRMFWMEKWEKNKEGEKELKSLLKANRATYVKGDKWQLQNYFIREFVGNGEKIRHGNSLDTTFSFKPEDFAHRDNKASAMTHDELVAYRKLKKAEGADVTSIDLEMYQRTSYPIATYILTLIGVSVSSRKSRQGIGIHLAKGLAVAALYVFSMRIATVGATNAGLHPLLATWLPNFVFLIIALWMYKRAPK
jgi:lipopolysaccharide export system permease protein